MSQVVKCFMGLTVGSKLVGVEVLELYLVRLNLAGLSLAGAVGKIDSLEIITISLQSGKP